MPAQKPGGLYKTIGGTVREFSSAGVSPAFFRRVPGK
jgi:hypothetical protein